MFDFHGWAKRWVQKSFTHQEWLAKKEELRTWSLEHGVKGCQVNQVWLVGLLKEIDRVFYEKHLLAMCRKAFKEVRLSTPLTSESMVGGLVVPTDQFILFQIPLDLVSRLSFPENKTSGYYVAGQLCQSAFECLLPVILHETIHLFLLSWAMIQELSHQIKKKKKVYPGGRVPHDGMFKRLAKQWFHQTDYRHGLFDHLPQTMSFEDHKSQLGPEDEVEYSPAGTSKWCPGTMISVGRWYARVQLPNGDQIKTHIGRVKKT